MPRPSTNGRTTKPTAKHCPLFVGNSKPPEDANCTAVREVPQQWIVRQFVGTVSREIGELRSGDPGKSD